MRGVQKKAVGTFKVSPRYWRPCLYKTRKLVLWISRMCYAKSVVFLKDQFPEAAKIGVSRKVGWSFIKISKF